MPYIVTKYDDFGEPLLREWRAYTYAEIYEKLGDALF